MLKGWCFFHLKIILFWGGAVCPIKKGVHPKKITYPKKRGPFQKEEIVFQLLFFRGRRLLILSFQVVRPWKLTLNLKFIWNKLLFLHFQMLIFIIFQALYRSVLPSHRFKKKRWKLVPSTKKGGFESLDEVHKILGMPHARKVAPWRMSKLEIYYPVMWWIIFINHYKDPGIPIKQTAYPLWN